jgi:hypothetical protein
VRPPSVHSVKLRGKLGKLRLPIDVSSFVTNLAASDDVSILEARAVPFPMMRKPVRISFAIDRTGRLDCRPAPRAGKLHYARQGDLHHTFKLEVERKTAHAPPPHAS